ncbi:hypothetical protein DL93DRAFT_365285 [Clavulina sp. PMI_390]|nr:hypothetical protein DL93DRAFT_365285 [Clavulina sp. PMI_390]
MASTVQLRSPFDLLPIEIIISIFRHVLSHPTTALNEVHDIRSDQIAITATCHRWREIALSEASFWTTIHIVLPCPEERAAIIEQISQRSSGRPLSLYVTTTKREDYSEDEYYLAPNPKLRSFIYQHLIPRADFLWLDAAFPIPSLEDDEEDTDSLIDWFPLPLPDNHKLHTLHLGDKACPEEDEDKFQIFSESLIPPLHELHISCWLKIIPSLKEASPHVLVIDILLAEEIGLGTINDIGPLPQLKDFSLTCYFPHEVFPELNSASLRHLDIFLGHVSVFPDRETLVLSQLPSLESLIIRVGPVGELNTYSDDEFEERGAPPKLPRLRELTVKPSMPHFQMESFQYELCKCVGTFLLRTNALVMLNVHHGHAREALESLIHSHDLYPSLKCIRTTAVEHTGLLGGDEIMHMACELGLSRPGLEVLWAESSSGDPHLVAVQHLFTPNANAWETDEEDVDDEDDETEDEGEQ